MDYNQYEANPTGLNYLAGDIMPWDDYVIFRTDEDTSISIYGQYNDKTDSFENATVRGVVRNSGSGYNNYYYTFERQYDEVTFDITEPYYAYGNLIGVPYSLPSSTAIIASIVPMAIIFCALVILFRTFFKLKRSIK